MTATTTCITCTRCRNGWCAHLDNIALRFNCESQHYLQSAGDPCIDFAERPVTHGVKRDINAFALMVQALSGKLTTPEPARPGPTRVHRWLGDEAEGARTLDGGQHHVPAVTDTGAKQISSLIASLIATASTRTALHPARPKLTVVDAEVDGLNAGNGAPAASGTAGQECATVHQSATRATSEPVGTQD